MATSYASSQPGMLHHSYIIVPLFLVTFGSGYMESEESKEHGHQRMRHCKMA